MPEKTVSKKKYESYVKNLKKGAKNKKLKFVKNNVGNRNNMQTLCAHAKAVNKIQ